MLLPALGQAKKVAKASVCINNLKQIGLATGNYIEDYNSLYPVYANQNPNISFMALLSSPYLGANFTDAQMQRGSWTKIQAAQEAPGISSMWWCPLDDIDQTKTNSGWRGSNSVPCSYGMTGNDGGCFSGQTASRGDKYFIFQPSTTSSDLTKPYGARKVTYVKNPSGRFYLCENYYGNFAGGSMAWDSTCALWDAAILYPLYAYNFSKHNGFTRPFLFGDFHVEPLKDNEFKLPKYWDIRQ